MNMIVSDTTGTGSSLVITFCFPFRAFPVGNHVTSALHAVPQVAALVALVSCERGYTGSGGRFFGASLLNDQRSQNAYGDYAFQYETSDGTYRQEEGSQNNGQVSRGRYS